jgi:uncharacterized membrane-anchored protein YitT (DUF2179 family)
MSNILGAYHIDKNAFFIISDAREVTGEGFSHH